MKITKTIILKILNSYKTCSNQSLLEILKRVPNCDSPDGELIDLANHIVEGLKNEKL